MASGRFPPLLALARQDGAELAAEIVQPAGEARQAVADLVVGQHRRDGGDQADGGGEQRLGDAGATTARLVLCIAAMAEKRVHDAPDRAEQADERGRRADVARNTIQRSIRSISRCTVTLMARSMRSRTLVWLISAPATRSERRHSPMAAANTEAIGLVGLVPSRSNRSSRLPPDQKRSSNPSASLLTLRSVVDFLEHDGPDPDAGGEQADHDELDDDVGLDEEAPQ